MALDGAFLHTIQSELTARIGARIDKIHQPSREEIVLILRWPGGSGRLLLSASASNARIHLFHLLLFLNRIIFKKRLQTGLSDETFQ